MNDDVDNPAPPTEALDAGPPPTMAIDQTLRLDHVIARGNISLPSHFGRYQVLKRIGLGGFASVYAAYDPQLESEVAVKVLAENHSANTLVRRRFVAEARVARRLGNDRLIGVFDLGETDDGRPYVVMELAPRGTLRQRVVRTGRPSRDDLVRLIDELGACMSAIHAKGVVHRDIKPSNLLFRAKAVDGFVPGRLIEDDEQLVLADFGLARDISDGASALTVGGGTEGYMAPEQAATDGKPDFRADLYAATVVVAEMTTGRHPLRLDLTTADISTEMLVALTRSLSVDRDKRPATAEEWRTELGRAYADDAALRSGGPAPSAADDATATIDATRIGNPLRFATELRTDVPGTDMEAASFTPAQPAVTPAADDTPDRLAPTASSPVDAAPSAPAPPPGLAAEADAERQQAPTPTAIHPERPAAVVAAARAQAEAEAREARRKAEEKEAKRAARAARRQARRGGGPGAATIAPPSPGRAADPPPSVPGSGPSGRTGGASAPPPSPPVAPPARPDVAAREPSPGPAERRPPTPAPTPAVAAPAEVRPAPPTAAPPPTARPVPRSGPTGGPASQTTAAPPGAARPPAGLPIDPATGRPVSNGPPSSRPATGRPTTVPAPVDDDRKRSREHLQTARKLAKLERKRNRKLARKARRRRRRRRVANFFLAIIRGILGGLLFVVGGYLVAVGVLGIVVEEQPGFRGLVAVIAVIGFLWGTSYFPIPRSYDI